VHSNEHIYEIIFSLLFHNLGATNLSIVIYESL